MDSSGFRSFLGSVKFTFGSEKVKETIGTQMVLEKTNSQKSAGLARTKSERSGFYSFGVSATVGLGLQLELGLEDCLGPVPAD